MYTRNCSLSVSIRRLLILVVALCLGGVYAASGQTTSTTLSKGFDEGAIRERIDTIIRETIKKGKGYVNGIKVWTRVPPSSKDVEEINAYGYKAIPFLEEYLFLDVGPEGELAIQILGRLGGSRIVEPLKRVVEQSTSANRRDAALRSLTQAPWESASPIIRNAAETDRDPNVRAEARDLLIRYAPKREPS